MSSPLKFALIAFSATKVSEPREDVNKPNTEPFSFDDIFSGEFVPKSFASEWFEGKTDN